MRFETCGQQIDEVRFLPMEQVHGLELTCLDFPEQLSVRHACEDTVVNLLPGMETVTNSHLPALNLPALHPPAVVRGYEVMCRARRKFVKLEPEEWVRQHWLGFLADGLGFPAGAISVEHPLLLNGMRRRADILCQTPNAAPLLLLECKAPAVKLGQEALDQVWRYGLALKALPPVIVLSNGVHHQAFLRKSGDDSPQVLDELPTYQELRRMTAEMP